MGTKKRQAHNLFRSHDLTLLVAGILLQKKMDSAARVFFCFPVRFVHCKYNTLIFEKKYCKGTSFVLERYYFGTIYRICAQPTIAFRSLG